MHFSIAILAALASNVAGVALPQNGAAKTDPADGPLPPNPIKDACTNMFTQPNPTPQTVFLSLPNTEKD
jgi:hypothetical protein